MPSSRPTPRKGIKFLDVKLFIGALALAVTIGFWNLFSDDAIQAAQSAPGDTAVEAAQLPAGAAAGGGPPLPTLVPLATIVVSGMDGANGAAPAQAAGQDAPLRAVAAPTQQIVQKHKPIVGQSVQTANNGSDSNSGGGGGGGGQPAPVTQTGSSK